MFIATHTDTGMTMRLDQVAVMHAYVAWKGTRVGNELHCGPWVIRRAS